MSGKGGAPDPRLQRAIALYQRNELAEAETLLRQHLTAAPKSWQGRTLLAIVAARSHRPQEAEAIWLDMVAQEPAYVDGHSNLGLMYRGTGRLAQAREHLERARALAPQAPTVLLNLGLVYNDLGLLDDAMAAFEASLAADPRSAQAHFNIAVVWQARLDYERASVCYREALRLDPLHQGAQNNLLFVLQYLPDMSAGARLDEARRLGDTLCRHKKPRTAWLTTHTTSDADRPLRVGLVSGDLRGHPVGYFLEPVLLALQGRGLQLWAYSNHPDEDALSARIRPCFEAWHAVSTWSDDALARRIVDDRIDILIDLAGHSAANRLPVFAGRPAPVQASWLGYFATTGLATMDYVLADPVCVPPGEEGAFVEQVWRLPDTRLCYAPPPDAPPVAATPSVTRGHVTFGSFQELAKINDAVLRLWARILAAAPQATLRIQSARINRTEARETFIRRALACGLPAHRLVLVGSMPRGEYLAAHAEVDLLLDTFPYPGGTTTCDALWMGVPTLTLATPGMLGRQGEGLLHAAGLGNWVCRTDDDYVARATAWATGGSAATAALAELRQGMRDRLRASPLLDASRFAAHFETALRGMWQQRLAAAQGTRRG